MNSAIKQHIGGNKSRNSNKDDLNKDGDAEVPKNLPPEAIKFAKSMGIDMTGIEAEAEDMWRMLNEMHSKSPLEYHQFVQQQFEEAKEEGILPGAELPPDYDTKNNHKKQRYCVEPSTRDLN